jgi:hypothetical protein
MAAAPLPASITGTTASRHERAFGGDQGAYSCSPPARPVSVLRAA